MKIVKLLKSLKVSSRPKSILKLFFKGDFYVSFKVSRCAEKHFQHELKDSEKFYKAYKKRGGKCSFDAFSELLRAFY